MKTVHLTRAVLLSSTMFALVCTTLPARAKTYTYGSQAPNTDAPIKVSLNGKMVDVGSVAPVQVSHRLLIPLRGVLEAMGATVTYNDKDASITVQRGATIVLHGGSNLAVVNGQAREFDFPVQSLYGKTMIPLRFVAENLGAKVSWDAAHRVVSIVTESAR